MAILGVMLAVSMLAPLGATAWANGRYPAAGQLVVDPIDAQRIVVRTTFGLLQTTDNTKHWQWICETAAGYEDNTDPYFTVGGSGALVVATATGMTVSSDRGCVWTKLPGSMGQLPAYDLVVSLSSPLNMWAVDQSDGGLLQLLASTDGGLHFSPQGAKLPSGFSALTLEVAPSNPQRIYVSGQQQQTQSVIMRSDDGGASWQALPMDTTDIVGDFVGAVDPQQPDRLYVRRNTDTGDALLFSSDAGLTWQQAFATPGKLLGFALSPDGQTVALGVVVPQSPELRGLWLASSSDMVFHKVQDVQPTCLTWTAQGLWICALQSVDHFVLGRSEDAGKSIKPLLQLADIKPLSCPVGTRTANVCPAAWTLVAKQLGVGTSPVVAPAQPISSGCNGFRGSSAIAVPWLTLILLLALGLRTRRVK